MATSVELLTLSANGDTHRSYHEFDSEIDGESLSAALLKAYGTRAASLEEMLYMTIVAAAKDDRTTINGLAAVRKYWREHPEAQS